MNVCSVCCMISEAEKRFCVVSLGGLYIFFSPGSNITDLTAIFVSSVKPSDSDINF